MRLERLDADSGAGPAAVIAEAARSAIEARGIFSLALSGGRTPGPMLRALAGERVPWRAVHVFQVDERVAPEGDPARNLVGLRADLLAKIDLPASHVHAMPVDEPDLEAAARRYARALERVAGVPAVLDVVQLGLGADGHTASLVPGDPALEVGDSDVALSGVYQGRRRMTLTYPLLNRARCIVWLVTGAEKAAALVRLRRADASIPAGRVRQERALLFADRAALAEGG